jgi:hypothetical protein
MHPRRRFSRPRIRGGLKLELEWASVMTWTPKLVLSVYMPCIKRCVVLITTHLSLKSGSVERHRFSPSLLMLSTTSSFLHHLSRCPHLQMRSKYVLI